MAKMASRHEKRQARHLRVRKRVKGIPQRPRLSVSRSLRHIYAQVIDDTVGHTLVAVSSLKPEEANLFNGVTKTQAARLVGTQIARQAKAAGVIRVAFDRGGNRYHGRVKALAEAAREGGLEF